MQGSEKDSVPFDVPSTPSQVTCLMPVRNGGTADYGPCDDQYLTGFGGHIMMRGQSAVGRISGVLLNRMGQTNVLGHYPLHWHSVGSGGSQSFVQVCTGE